jgi:hypothetical protein
MLHMMQDSLKYDRSNSGTGKNGRSGPYFLDSCLG